MRLKFNIDSAQWVKEGAEKQRVIATSVTNAMRETGKRAAAAANEVIHAGGFASRKWELRPKNFPSSGVSLLPEVWLHSRINFEDIFEEGGIIHGNPWLWLPLPSVPKWPGDATRQMSPKKYAETIGPLVTIRRRGKPPMLGAAVTGRLPPQPFGRFVTRGRLRKGRGGKGPVTIIPLFVAVSSVVIEKRFDTAAAVEKATEDIQNIYIVNETREQHGD